MSLERTLIDLRVMTICSVAVVLTICPMRDAADHMVREKVGRLPVVARDNPSRLVGIISRSDLLSAHASRLEEDV